MTQGIVYNELHVAAPGKVILCGEHAVVYGKSAIACSLGLLTTGSIRLSDSLTLIMDNFNFNHSWSLNQFSDQKISCNNYTMDHVQLQRIKEIINFETDIVSNSVSTFLYLWLSIRNNHKGVSLSLNSDLPIGGGLGSSAS